MDKENPFIDSQGVFVYYTKNPSNSQFLLVEFSTLEYTLNMLINAQKRVFLFSSLLLIFGFSVVAKSKKSDEPYKKYVHPRIYDFDLVDAKENVFLGYNKDSDTFEQYIDFTSFVKDDMPQAGDKVVFHYKGYATNDAKNITAEVWDNSNWILLSSSPKTFAENVKKKEPFEKTISFILNNSAKSKFTLKIYSSMENEPWILNQCYFHFERLVTTTDTTKELAAEKKAESQNVEIIEVKTEIKDDEEILKAEEAKKQAEEEALLAAEKEAEKARIAEEEQIAAEAKKKVEEIARLTAQKEAGKKEAEKKQSSETAEKKQDETKQTEADLALERALAKPSSSSSSYKKEYLNDYMVSDDLVLDQTEEIEEIIENPDECDDFGTTLLMQAAKTGNDWQVKTLLKSGAKVNLKDKDGWTALMYAVRYQESMTCVELLINAGAEVKALNNYKASALSLAACYNNNPEIIKKLLSYYSPSDKEVLKSCVLLLSENHTSEYLQLSKLNVFMELGLPINSFYEGKTPLMYAAEYGNSTKAIKVLLENNAVTSIRSSEGKTAYDYASENKKLAHDKTYWELNKK